MTCSEVLNAWQGIQKKRYEEINLNSRTTATLGSLIETIASSFGGSKIDFDPDKFLPIHFKDSDSPVEQMRRELGTETIAIARELLVNEKIPPQVTRMLFSIDELKTILIEEN